jgi:hypothetical protein
MGKKLYPTDTLKQARSILSAWKLIDPSLKIGPLTSEEISADIETAYALQEKILILQAELSNIRYQRDITCIGIWNKVKRTRSGVKGIYGDDSTAYKLAGGTPRSERKKPRRKALSVSKEERSVPEHIA